MVAGEIIFKLRQKLFKSAFVYKPLLFAVKSLAWTCWSWWYYAFSTVRDSIANQADYSDTIWLSWVYFLVTALIIYPFLYFLVRRQVDREMKVGKVSDDDEKVLEEKVEAKSRAKSLDLIIDTLSYVVARSFMNALNDSAYDSDAVWWYWLWAVVMSLAGAFGGYLIQQAADVSKGERRKKTYSKMATVFTGNFAWTVAVAWGDAVTRTLQATTGSGNSDEVSSDAVLYLWIYFAVCLVISILLFVWLRRVAENVKKDNNKAEREIDESLIDEVFDELDQLFGFVRKLYTKASIWIAAIAFRKAAEITILYSEGLSYDDYDNLGNWQSFVYAVVCILIFSLITIALEKFLEKIIESPLVSMKTAAMWNDVIKILTNGMAYITGAAWSTFLFGWIYDDDAESNIFVVFMVAIGMTFLASLAENWLIKLFANKQRDLIVANFEKVKKEQDVELVEDEKSHE